MLYCVDKSLFLFHVHPHKVYRYNTFRVSSDVLIRFAGRWGSLLHDPLYESIRIIITVNFQNDMYSTGRPNVYACNILMTGHVVSTVVWGCNADGLYVETEVVGGRERLRTPTCAVFLGVYNDVANTRARFNFHTHITYSTQYV